MTGGLSGPDRARLRKSGLVPITAEQGTRMFDLGRARTTGVLVPAGFALHRMQSPESVPPLLRRLVSPQARRRAAAASGQPTGLASRLVGLTPDAARVAVTEAITAAVAAVLGYAAAELPESTPLKDLGFDSLTSLELRNRLNTLTGLRMPTTLVFDYPTVAAIAAHVAGQLQVPAAAAAGAAIGRRATDVRELLAGIPIGKLRRAGLLEMLLDPTDGRTAEPAAEVVDLDEDLAALDVDSLVRLAFDGDNH
jgi:acyl carrier protein